MPRPLADPLPCLLPFVSAEVVPLFVLVQEQVPRRTYPLLHFQMSSFDHPLLVPRYRLFVVHYPTHS
jgi:hypothetical protein